MIWVSAILVLGNLFSTLGWLILLSDVTQNRISLEERFLSISSVITIFAFAFPWAVNVVDLGVAGLFKMFIFMGLLFIGLIYIYKKKALSWD
jgi:NADH-quinone oxidoreductase subunit A